MFENDYIMRMIMQLGEAIRRSLEKQHENLEDELDDIEGRIGDAVDMDSRMLLSLAPESIVSVLGLGAFDADLAGYVVRALYYEADILEQSNLFGRADLRRAQAGAIAGVYGIDPDVAMATPEMLEEYFRAQAETPAVIDGTADDSGPISAALGVGLPDAMQVAEGMDDDRPCL